MTNTVHLGFEVPSGEPVEIPISHLCVTGQTQLSGKTTTLSALVLRSGLAAIAFKTKRGEGAFGLQQEDFDKKETQVAPFFRHRADWQFVSDILGAILHEKLKFQRSWIMKVCRGANTLQQVHANVKAQLTRKLRGLDESVYTELDHYFELLLPELERLPASSYLHIERGLNIMDLSEYSTALQMLVVSSVLEEVYKKRTGVIVVIPEAWEFVPNNRNSPAKSAAITLARKGAALKNYLWLDSQDLASIDTEVRRACGVWILGVQRERNEVERVLKHIPAGTKKPKVDDIMYLERGQFFVCHGRTVQKVYVEPAWMTAADAKGHATGALPPTSIKMKYMNSKTGETFDRPPGLTACPGMPEGLPGMPLTYFIENGGESVDQQEREQYENTITTLYQALYNVQRQLPRRNYAKDHSFEEWLEDFKCLGASFREDSGSVLDDSDMPPSYHARFAFEDSSANVKAIGDQVVAELQAVTDQAIADRVMERVEDHLPEIEARIFARCMARLPSNGVLRVEPREVVLREFQEAQVGRILESAKNLTPFQKQVLRYAHAKSSRATKKDLFKAIVGKDPQGGSVQQSRYQEIDGLVALGMLRADGGFFYPNLGVGIMAQLRAYDATNEQVDDVVGQVLLRLK